MKWLVDNWSLLVVLIAFVVTGIFAIKHFVGMPTDEQIASVKKWLLWAVMEAEKDLGAGTGKLKLRQVYDMFVTRFPWVAKCVSFDQFSIWVDEVLLEMEKILQTNNNIRMYVKG